MVPIAVAASYAISALGSGMKAVITLALCLAFGVVLIVLRALMQYANSAFVKIVCFASAGVILSVFLIFVLLLVPAATVCWPKPYAEMLTLPRCPGAVIAETVPDAPFKAVAFVGTGITFDADKGKYLVLVFYRRERLEDAEHVVGALQSAGYKSQGMETSLDEVLATDRRPDSSLVKTTTLARPIVDDVVNVVRLAVPGKADFVSLFPEDAPLQRGNVQVSLF